MRILSAVTRCQLLFTDSGLGSFYHTGWDMLILAVFLDASGILVCFGFGSIYWTVEEDFDASLQLIFGSLMKGWVFHDRMISNSILKTMGECFYLPKDKSEVIQQSDEDSLGRSRFLKLYVSEG